MNKSIFLVFPLLLATLPHLLIAEDQLKPPDAGKYQLLFIINFKIYFSCTLPLIWIFISADGLYSEKPVKCSGHHVDVEHTFSWQDYSVLAAMLIISCGIGVFYGFLDSKQSTKCDDFLTGGGAMGTFPMAMSLAARCVWMFW